MTKEEKIEKRKLRKHRRCEKRREKFKEEKESMRRYFSYGLSLSQARQMSKYGYFTDTDGAAKIAGCYFGICTWPCKGDC